MKLRIKGDSLRLRVSRSELARFLAGERVEETIHFTAAPQAKLTYVLQLRSQPAPAAVEYENAEVRVLLSEEQAGIWAQESEVGVYTRLNIGEAVSLEVIVEKDFACLDRSDQDNQDTFENPHKGAVC